MVSRARVLREPFVQVERFLGAWYRFLRGYLRSRVAAVGFVLFVVTLLVALGGPLVSPYDPIKTDLIHRLKPPVGVTKDGKAGSWSHPLGTDHLGRDVLTRTLYGGRLSLLVAVPATAIGAVIGVLMGLYAGYHRGLVDTVLMRVVDLQRAIPFLIIAIAVLAFLGSGVPEMVGLLGVWTVGFFARLVRGDTLAAVNQEYITAATALGAGATRIMVRHLLPNVLAPVIVLATFLLPQLIVVESALSFLGLGIPRPNPSWGNMLSESREFIQVAWWTMAAPAFLLSIAVLAFNLVGDRLREIWDPSLRGRTEA